MVEQIIDIASRFWETIGQMAPFLLFGFLAAGMLSVLVSAEWIQRHLGTGRFASVIKASAFGVPLPLCSCSVIPVATSLRRHGAGKGAVTAFLISTPQTGVDSIFATFSLLGWTFAIFRPIAALISGILGGGLVAMTGGHDQSVSDEELPECTDACCTSKSGGKFVGALRYGLLDLPRDIGKALLFGLFLGAIITVVIGKNDYFAQVLPPGAGQVLLLMLVGIPLYICATASIPIAASLILAGVSPGAAFALLMTGPATNVATISTIWKVLGPRTCLIYLGTMMLAAFAGGMLLDQLISLDTIQATMMHHDWMPAWFRHASAVALIGVLIAGVWPRSGEKHDHEHDQDALGIEVIGMTCNHCTASVKAALSSCTGVSEVSVDLASKTARISGENIDRDELITAIENAGFTALSS